LHFLEALLDLVGAIIKLTLAGFQRRFETVEANEIVLVLGLFPGKRLLILRELVFPVLEIGFETGKRGFEVRLAPGQQAGMFFELAPSSRLLRGLRIKVQLAGVGLLLFRVELLFALLDFPGGTVNGFVQSGEAVAAMAIAVVELLANIGQFPADAFELLLPAVKLLTLLLERLLATFKIGTRLGKRGIFTRSRLTYAPLYVQGSRVIVLDTVGRAFRRAQKKLGGTELDTIAVRERIARDGLSIH
jgi:hypothetical protein